MCMNIIYNIVFGQRSFSARGHQRSRSWMYHWHRSYWLFRLVILWDDSYKYVEVILIFTAVMFVLMSERLDLCCRVQPWWNFFPRSYRSAAFSAFCASLSLYRIVHSAIKHTGEHQPSVHGNFQCGSITLERTFRSLTRVWCDFSCALCVLLVLVLTVSS